MLEQVQIIKDGGKAKFAVIAFDEYIRLKALLADEVSQQVRELAAETAPRHSEVSLSGEIAPGWRVITPLTITVARDEDGSYVASEDTLAVYGVGDTLFAALQDYVVSLIDYY